ncbi:MAG: DUF4114 domain-containing protein [Desulfobacter sp.]|nr:MAG: DUF4114 domain-containing protein [Desulfobacter sp.]
MRIKVILLLVLGCFLWGGTASALPVGTALQDALNERTKDGQSVDVQNDMIGDNSDSAWNITASTGSVNTMLFEFAGYAENTSFGIYDLADTTKRLELFAGEDSNDGTPYDGAQATLGVFGNSFTADNWTNSVTFSSSTFGYYISVGDTGNVWYSDSSLNSDESDHMLAYQGDGTDEFSVYNDGNFLTWSDNEFILAWEDLAATSADWDFTDFVVMVESVEPVPEPTTMLLFGMGLLGLAGITRRKKN